MPDTHETFGNFNGYVLTLQRRVRRTEDANRAPLLTGTSVQALTLTKGATVVEIAVGDDTPPHPNAFLASAGKLLISAAAAAPV